MMARISSTRVGERYRIAIAGALGARDLRRLESACRHALVHKHVPLEIDLEWMTAADPPAQTYLDHLQTRGATIRGQIAGRSG
jgi:hypothetical protein